MRGFNTSGHCQPPGNAATLPAAAGRAEEGEGRRWPGSKQLLNSLKCYSIDGPGSGQHPNPTLSRAPHLVPVQKR